MVKKVLKEGGPQLLREIVASGDLELFHARIIQHHNLAVKYVIFYACLDDSEDFVLTTFHWHTMWKNVAEVVHLYNLTHIGIKLPVTLMRYNVGLVSRLKETFSSRVLEGDILSIIETVFHPTDSDSRIHISLFV